MYCSIIVHMNTMTIYRNSGSLNIGSGIVSVVVAVILLGPRAWGSKYESLSIMQSFSFYY